MHFILSSDCVWMSKQIFDKSMPISSKLWHQFHFLKSSLFILSSSRWVSVDSWYVCINSCHFLICRFFMNPRIRVSVVPSIHTTQLNATCFNFLNEKFIPRNLKMRSTLKEIWCSLTLYSKRRISELLRPIRNSLD